MIDMVHLMEEYPWGYRCSCGHTERFELDRGASRGCTRCKGIMRRETSPDLDDDEAFCRLELVPMLNTVKGHLESGQLDIADSQLSLMRQKIKLHAEHYRNRTAVP